MVSRRFLALFASNLVSLPISLVLTALLLRYLGVAGFGQVAWLSAVLLLGGNIALETLQSFTLAGSPRTHLVAQLMGKGPMLVGVGSAGLALLGWMIWGAQTYAMANLAIVAMVLIVTMGLTGVIWAELRNRDDYLVPNLISRLVQACVLLAGSTLLHHWGMLSVHTTLTLYAVASVLTLLLLTAYQPSLPDAVAWVMGRQTGRLFSYFKDNALTITAPQITLILPGFFVGPETLAVLRVAQQMANLSLLLPTSIYYIYVPRLVQTFKAHALAPYRAAMRFVRLWGTASLLFAIGAAVILTPIVGRLFSGVDMTQTYTLFLWLSVGNMAAAALGPTNQVLSLIGRVDFNFHLMVVSTAAMGVMGGLVMGMGADIVYFIALTALSTTLVKIVAQRELTKQETSGPQMKNSGQSHSEAGHKG
jgi:O-antigen/teichoic acid export membrane protein